MENTGRLLAEHVTIERNGVDGEISEIRISLAGLRGKPWLVIRELCKYAWQQADWPLRDMGYYQWQQMAQLTHTTNPSPIVYPGTVRAEIVDAALVLRRVDLR
jgi:hypothetical protein